MLKLVNIKKDYIVDKDLKKNGFKGNILIFWREGICCYFRSFGLWKNNFVKHYFWIGQIYKG